MGPLLMKIRLDQLLVERAMAPSREAARRSIMAGEVYVEGQRLDKPGRNVDSEAGVEVRRNAEPYVSRGGIKLAGALEKLEFTVPAGCLALDIGASTGGFTDCLLQRGAGRVIAVDVGRGQLHERLRADPRVTAIEKTNARRLDLAAIGGRPVDLVTIDVSFISLRLILPACAAVLAPGARVLALIKPQFEAGRSQVGKGGVVRRREVHAEVLTGILAYCAEAGWQVEGLTPSPLRGPRGNLEFFALLSRPGTDQDRPEAPNIDVEATLEEAYNLPRS